MTPLVIDEVAEVFAGIVVLSQVVVLGNLSSCIVVG
jgi:hypothetical protein